MNRRLIIENVDIFELDEQRQHLATIEQTTMTARQYDAINGIINMLDQWSDDNQEELKQ